MKTSRFIFRKLVSPKAGSAAERLREVKVLGHGEGVGATAPKPGDFLKPKRLASWKSSSRAHPDRESQRLVLVSPLPGRWIRFAGAAVACACLLAANVTLAAGGTESFNAANAAYAQGRFAEAVRGFESVLAHEGYSAPVLYNLANAQFRDGKVGGAILNYERALELAPNDPEIAANLRAARTKAGVAASEPSPMSRFTHSLSLNAWANLSVLTLFLVCITVLLRRRLPGVRAALGLVGAFAAIALVAGLSAIAWRWPELDRAIVIDRNCNAGIAPVTMAESLFTLPEGEAVIIRQTRGSFVLVRSRSGRSGWVKQDRIRQVLAESPVVH